MQVHEEFSRALDALVEQIKSDRSIVAAILCGSLSHDTVWAKSDIDLVLVTVDDKKLGSSDMALYADGVNVHAILMPRTEFRKTAESSIQNSFMHSFLAKGRLLYSHDPTIADLCDGLVKIGARDAELQLFSAAIHVLSPMYKARKWFVTRGDLEYTALWILYTATPLAKVELSIDGGRSWQAAQLGLLPDTFAWRRFSATLAPPRAGAIEIIARASDTGGRSQPLESAPWNPKGYCNNTVHRVHGRIG